MSQRFSMYPDLSVAREHGLLRDHPRRRARPSAHAAAGLLGGMGLAEFTKRQAQHLSGGMKQKLMLATTLMHRARPAAARRAHHRRRPGLAARVLADPRRAAPGGKTVLVATPYMDEAERCTQIAFIDSGRIKQFGTPDEIKARVPGRLVEVSATLPAGGAGRRPAACPAWSRPTCSATWCACCGRVAASPSTALGAALAAAGVHGAAPARSRPTWRPCSPTCAGNADAGALP